jgi:hypothetical protein
MGKIPKLSGQELIKILKIFGFLEVRQKGSHIILKKLTDHGEIGTAQRTAGRNSTFGIAPSQNFSR